MPARRPDAPRERAPLLLVFGALAPRVAALIRARPALVARLIVAPREAVHAYAAYLHLAPDASRPDGVVAGALLSAGPRDLLRPALPGCPPRLYRSLDRAGDRVRPRAFYERLGALCRGPFGEALLDGDAPLDEARLGYFEALAAMDPALVPLCRALPVGTYWTEAVDSLLALLRAHGALLDDDLRLPRGAGVPAVARRLRAALGRIRAPDPGFAAPAPFRLVRTTGDLESVGRAFRNCLTRLDRWGSAERHLRLLDGTEAYLVSEEPPLLAALRRVAPGVWKLHEMAGPGNEAPPPGAWDALVRDLTAAGLRIVATDPRDALGRLEEEARRGRGGRRRADEDEDDGLDAGEAGGEEVAAA